MKIHLISALLIASAIFLPPASLSAQQPRVFEENDSIQTLSLAGEKFTVAGSGNTLLILGSCSALVVTGSNNTIRVRATDQIEITGSNNNITWSAGIERDLPQVDDQGKDNTVQSGEVSPNDQ